MRSLALVAVSVIAVTSCKSQQPDGEWKPKDEAVAAKPSATPDSIPAQGDAGSAEALPAGTQPPTSPDTAAPGGSDAAAKPAAAVVGTVDATEEKPVILRDTVPVDAKVGVQVLAGDKIQTGERTKIRIKLVDDSILALGPRSSITMVKYEATTGGKRSGSLRVAIGAFWMQVSKWATPADSFVEVETPNAVAGVRGTTLWGDTQRQVVCALEGEVSVTSVSNKHLKPASLKAGHCVGKLGSGKLAPITPDGKTVAAYLDEVQIK